MFQVVFWIVMPCGVVVGYLSFGGPHCLHVQGEGSTTSPWRRRQCDPPKCRYSTTTLRGATTQKISTWKNRSIYVFVYSEMSNVWRKIKFTPHYSAQVTCTTLRPNPSKNFVTESFGWADTSFRIRKSLRLYEYSLVTTESSIHLTWPTVSLIECPCA
jgi:hypothetical protein